MLIEFIKTIMLAYPLFFSGTSSSQAGREWNVTRLDALSPIGFTTNPAQWQCFTMFNAMEETAVRAVMHDALNSPRTLFGYNTSFLGRVEAVSIDGEKLRVRAHHPITSSLFHQACWIYLIEDITHCEVSDLHTAIQSAAQ